MVRYAELAISLEREGADSFSVAWRFSRPDSDAESSGRSSGHRLSIDELPRVLLDASAARAYGACLGQKLFGIPSLKEALTAGRAIADQAPLRLRLALPPHDLELQALRWETLADPDAPEPGASLFTGERVLFSRYVESKDWRSAPRRAKGSLRALVVVANPSKLGDWAPDGVPLAPVNVGEEVDRARKGLAGIAVTTLGEDDRATPNNLLDRLRDGPDILYLVCHGALIDGQPQLWLEDDAGKVAITAGTELVTRLSEFRQPPRLIVLLSCQSAGSAEGDTLCALGPRLGEAGVPAVLAMHGNVSMETVETFMPVFFHELQKEGQIDQAVARARTAIRDRPDAWAPVLYMRLQSGSLWYQPSFATDRGRSYEGWGALINHIESGNCTPILGPGMTESLIGPRRERARRWAEEAQFPMAPHEQDDLPQVAQYVLVNQKDTKYVVDELRKSVQRGLLEQLGGEAADELVNASVDQLLIEIGKRRWAVDTNEPHWVLAQAPFPVFITTTFSSLLAEALRAAGKAPREELFRWNDYADWPLSIFEDDPDYIPTAEAPLIFHLFGRLTVEGSLVITEDDYFNYLIGATRNSALIPSVVRARLAETALLFLGFEMDGWDFRVLFRSFMTYLETQFSQRKKARIAHAGVQVDLEEGRLLKPERARDFIQSYFGDANVQIYWGNVEDFARDLSSRR